MRLGDAWRLDPAVTFLNHGSYGSCPAPVLAAQAALRDELEAAPIAFLSRSLPERLAAAREVVGAFLHADPDGLAFVTNATAGVNTVLRSLAPGLRPGDELLTDDHEYNAVINAMRAAATPAGASVVVAHVPFPIDGPDAVVEAFLDAATPRTRLVVVSHITSPTALVLPIERLVRAFAERGVDVLVDGAHAPGQVPVDLDALAPAYWTGNAHKWLCAPKGSGILWVRRDRREGIHPLVISHGANAPLDGGSRYRLEADWTGTADPSAALAIPAAIAWMAAQEPGGWPDVMAANHALALEGRLRLLEALDAPAPAPESMLGAMAAVPIPGVADDAAAADLATALLADGIEVPINGWPVPAARRDPSDPPAAALLRISAQRYNEPADYDRLAASLARLVSPSSAGPPPPR